MKEPLPLSGYTFNGITVNSLSDKRSAGSRHSYWNCSCHCGKKFVVSRNQIICKAPVTGCGCVWRQAISLKKTKHGHGYGSKEYGAWCKMKDRCLNPRTFYFEHYGGRGITICDRWLNSFENFISDMGICPEPKYSLDRIDFNGNYEPSNCRWADDYVQMNNTRRNRFIEIDGVILTMSQWAKKVGISGKVISRRINGSGWGEREAVLTPLCKSRHSRIALPLLVMAMFASCSIDKRLASISVKHNDALLRRCNVDFPPRIDTVTRFDYIEGQAVTSYDTVTIDCDSVIEQSLIPGSTVRTKFVRVPCPGNTFRVDTVKVTITITQTDTKAEKLLVLEKAKSDDYESKFKTWRKRAWWSWGALALLVVIGVGGWILKVKKVV